MRKSCSTTISSLLVFTVNLLSRLALITSNCEKAPLASKLLLSSFTVIFEKSGENSIRPIILELSVSFSMVSSKVKAMCL